MRIEAGLVIGNRFRLLSLVGEGAFGSLWRAADRVPGKQVAIRIISDAALGAAALDSFRSEMMIATTVRHRSLAPIYAVGRDPSGAVWVASELVDGESLESVLERQAPPSAVQALSMIAELAFALAELHALGLAHSAVSARTVLLMPRSRNDAMRPTLIGLGCARLLGSKQPLHGLPEAAYFSPEAFASQQYSAASDIWSLGVLLFRCVSGRLPFAARTAAAMQVETRRLNRLLFAIEEPSVRLLIAECFALDPERRPNASDLARRALVLAREVDDEEPTAIFRGAGPPGGGPRRKFSRPDPAARSAQVPVESSPATTPSSLAPIEISAEPILEDPAPESPLAVAPQPFVAAAPFNDVDIDVAVDFRPSRRRAKFIVAVAAAAAILAELILATREPRPEPPVAAHVDSEPARIPEPPPAVTLTPPAPTTTEVAAVASTAPTPTATTAAPSAAAAVATQKPTPKSRPGVAAKAAPHPANNAGDDNPYE